MNEIKPRNPITQAKHRREVFWQITFPVIVGAILLVVVCVLVGIGETAQVRQGADVAIIWLIVPAMIFTFILLALFGGLAYGVIKLIQFLPYGSYRLQEILLTIRIKAQQISDGAVKPVTAASGAWAAVKALFGRGRAPRRP